MIKHSMTVAALAVALATPAFAQQPSQPPQAQPPMAQAPASMQDKTVQSSPSSMPAAEQKAGFVQAQEANEWRASKLIGASVYGPDNSSIGEINDVLIGDNGNIRAVVVGVGGFLGVGEKNVAVPFQALNISRKPNQTAMGKITVRFTKDELRNAPRFADYEASRPQTTGSDADNNQPMNKTGAMDKTISTKK